MSYSFTTKMSFFLLMNEETMCKFLHQVSRIRHNILWIFLGSNFHKKNKKGFNTKITRFLIFAKNSSSISYPPMSSFNMIFVITWGSYLFKNFKSYWLSHSMYIIQNQCSHDWFNTHVKTMGERPHFEPHSMSIMEALDQ